MAQRKRSGSEISFEASLQKLEAIVKRLEEEEIPLELSLKLFAEGQTLARACEEQLKAAENQIRLLLEKPSGQIEEQDFDAPELGSVARDDTEDKDDEEDEDKEDDEDDASGHSLDSILPRQAAPKPTDVSHPGQMKNNEPKIGGHNLDELPF